MPKPKRGEGDDMDLGIIVIDLIVIDYFLNTFKHNNLMIEISQILIDIKVVFRCNTSLLY